VIVSNSFRKHWPPAWSETHELVLNMRALWEIVKDDPVGPVTHRVWHIGSRTYLTKPDTFHPWDEDEKPEEPAEAEHAEVTRRDGSEFGLGGLAPRL
jgi:hypothetical protein